MTWDCGQWGRQSTGRSTWGIWGLGVPAIRGSMTRAVKRPCSSLISPHPLLNRKNGPAVRILIPGRFAPGGWRSYQTYDGQESKDHRRAHADREGLYQRPGSLHQGSDSASEKQAGKHRGWRMGGGVTSRSKFTHSLFADHLKASTNVSLKSGTVPGAAPELAFWKGDVPGLQWAEWEVRYTSGTWHSTCIKPEPGCLPRGQLRCYIPAPRLGLGWQLPPLRTAVHITPGTCPGRPLLAPLKAVKDNNNKYVPW